MIYGGLTIDVVKWFIRVCLFEIIHVVIADSHESDDADYSTEDAHIEENSKVCTQVISSVSEYHVRVLGVSYFSTDDFHKVVIFTSLSRFKKQWIKTREAATIIIDSINGEFGIVDWVIIELYLEADAVKNTIEMARVVEEHPIISNRFTLLFRIQVHELVLDFGFKVVDFLVDLLQSSWHILIGDEALVFLPHSERNQTWLQGNGFIITVLSLSLLKRIALLFLLGIYAVGVDVSFDFNHVIIGVVIFRMQW